MGVKFSSIVFMILAVFIAKISMDNFATAKAETQREPASLTISAD